MASALDVAQYILDSHGAMTTMKLQKLVYYAQAWSGDDNTLFDEPAWKAGPVVRALYEQHRGRFRLDTVGGNPGSLTGAQRDTIDLVLRFYGDKSAQWLSDLTHMEEPWKDAWARGNGPAACHDRSVRRQCRVEVRHAQDLAVGTAQGQ